MLPWGLTWSLSSRIHSSCAGLHWACQQPWTVSKHCLFKLPDSLSVFVPDFSYTTPALMSLPETSRQPCSLISCSANRVLQPIPFFIHPVHFSHEPILSPDILTLVFPLLPWQPVSPIRLSLQRSPSHRCSTACSLTARQLLLGSCHNSPTLLSFQPMAYWLVHNMAPKPILD